MRTTYGKQTSTNYLTDGVRAEKENNESAAQDQPSGNQFSGHHLQLQGQEQILKSTVVEIHPNEALERVLPLQEFSTEALSKQETFHNDEPAYELSRQCREDNLGRIVFSAELIDQSKENASNLNEPGHDPTCKSTGDDEHGHMDVSTELAKPSEENALIPDKSAQEAGNSSETTESVQPDLDHECRQEKHQVSLDNSLNSKENETQESIPMPVDKSGSQRGVAGESTPSGILNSDISSFAGSKNIQTKHDHHELERDRSVSPKLGTPTKRHVVADQPYNTDENSIETDNCRTTTIQPAPSQFQEQAPDQESKLGQSSYHLANASDGKMHIDLENAEQSPDKQKPNPVQFGATREDEAIIKDQPASHITSPTNVSSGQTPTSSQPISYPMPNVNQITSQNNQDLWQTHQSLAMNQMLQYHYQQQQYQQQQQLQMHQAYYQLQQNYQQFYQLQPQQQVQPMNQQQQLQSSPYQQHYQMQQQVPTFQQPQVPTFQQPQQHFYQQHYQQNQQQPVGHLQVQQGQETPLNFKQTHATQQQQSQDPTYQAHQLAYQQQASQAQQLLFQQYQQYQAYQHTQQQQQSQEGTNHTLEQHLHQHPVQKQQDESLQQHPHIISTKLTQNLCQNQQVCCNIMAPLCFFSLHYLCSIFYEKFVRR